MSWSLYIPDLDHEVIFVVTVESNVLIALADIWKSKFKNSFFVTFSSTFKLTNI